MKICNKCHIEKGADQFSKLKTGKMGLNPVCKQCRAALAKVERLANGDAVRAGERARHNANKSIKAKSYGRWYQKNSEARLERMAEYHAKNRERILAEKREYRAANREKIYVLNSARRAAEKRAMLPTCDRQKMRSLYAIAASLTKSTGVVHHVDHIVPLKGKNVCGLHVDWNMQVLPANENMQKSNKWTA